MNKNIRILIVDDEESVCVSLSEHLIDQEFQVSSVFSAEDALIQINKEQPDLMIVDIRLPGIDGTKLIEKTHEICPDIKYLIHTGSVAFVLPDNLANLGLKQSQIIKKPVRDLNIFNEKINNLFKKG